MSSGQACPARGDIGVMVWMGAQTAHDKLSWHARVRAVHHVRLSTCNACSRDKAASFLDNAAA